MEDPLDAVLKRYCYLENTSISNGGVKEGLKWFDIKIFRDYKNQLLRTVIPLVGLLPNRKYDGYLPFISKEPFLITTTNDKIALEVPEIYLPAEKIGKRIYIGIVIVEEGKIIIAQHSGVILKKYTDRGKNKNIDDSGLYRSLPCVSLPSQMSDLSLREDISLKDALKRYNYLSMYNKDIANTGFINILRELKIYRSSWTGVLKKIEIDCKDLKKNTVYYGYVPSVSKDKFKIVTTDTKICFDFPQCRFTIPDKQYILSDYGKRKVGGRCSFIGLVITDENKNVILGKIVSLVMFRPGGIKPYNTRLCSCFYTKEIGERMENEGIERENEVQEDAHREEQLEVEEGEEQLEVEQYEEERSPKQRRVESDSSDVQIVNEESNIQVTLNIPAYLRFL